MPAPSSPAFGPQWFAGGALRAGSAKAALPQYAIVIAGADLFICGHLIGANESPQKNSSFSGKAGNCSLRNFVHYDGFIAFG